MVSSNASGVLGVVNSPHHGVFMGVQDGYNDVKRLLNVHVVGTVVVGREIKASICYRRNGSNGLPIGQALLSMPSWCQSVLLNSIICWY